MKKNKMMRIASVLLVAVLLSTCVISGTFAKYTSTSSGSDTARVARWSILVEGTEIGVAGNTTVAFDLFKTVKDTAGNTENDVAVKDGAQIIAPGTSGSFTIDIVNDSEVNAKYTITLAETNTGNIPLQYSVDGENWVDSIAELSMTALTNVAIAMKNDGDTDTDSQTVYWRWVFNDTDTAVTDGSAHAGQTNVTDTALGNAGTLAEVTITATIVVEQVD